MPVLDLGCSPVIFVHENANIFLQRCVLCGGQGNAECIVSPMYRLGLESLDIVSAQCGAARVIDFVNIADWSIVDFPARAAALCRSKCCKHEHNYASAEHDSGSA